MNERSIPFASDKWIRSSRGPKNPVDSKKPYGWLLEKELTYSGNLEDTATIFLTNMECPFHCLMCDLWKNTTDKPLDKGSAPAQIKYALSNLPDARHVKLYNSGSFFDERAIPRADYREIAALLDGFESVIVESHPGFIDDKCLLFKNMIRGELQVALGLESSDNYMLERLNKRMTTEDFSTAVSFLTANGIRSRAFILLKPPFLTEEEGIKQAMMSIDFAFNEGVECCTVIPVRAGNGAMDHLQDKGLFSPPDIKSLETVLEYGISLKKGRVFADVWDLKLFSRCDRCSDKRAERLVAMNNSQTIAEPLLCTCHC